jgi:hypothetical protein
MTKPLIYGHVALAVLGQFSWEKSPSGNFPDTEHSSRR